jgi:carbon-monoxide dehydrogenase large subunit
VDTALTLDRDWKFLTVKIRSFGNLGAFVSFGGAMPAVVNIGMVCGVYLTPALHVAISGMLTNIDYASPYRVAARPEASLRDRAAD